MEHVWGSDILQGNDASGSDAGLAVDWVIIGLGSVGALGLVLGSRDIAYRGSWEKIVHGLIIVHSGIPWDGFRGSHPALLHAIP